MSFKIKTWFKLQILQGDCALKDPNNFDLTRDMTTLNCIRSFPNKL